MSAISSEWLKLRSVRSSRWFAGGALATMLLVAALNADDVAGELRAAGAAPGSYGAGETALAGVSWLHYILGALGMLAITSEYATRSIMVTLACTPSRTRMLLAKAAVVFAAVFAAGIVLAAGGIAAGAPMLGDYLNFDAGPLTARIAAMATYLALIAVLALGLGTLIRRSAGTLTVLFSLLAIVPAVLNAIAERLKLEVLFTISNLTPASAGERFMAGDTEYGLALVAWAGMAVAGGIWALRARDA